MNITQQQWNILAPLFERPTSLDPRGRKRRESKVLVEGILWILKTGAQWKELPDRYGSYQTVHRRYREWVTRGVFEEVLKRLAQDLESRGGISLEECFIDGTFASAKKGALILVLPNVEKVAKSWSSQTKALFQSPSIYPLLLQAKSDWWKKRLSADLRKRLQSCSLETKHMILIH
jgi:transposase